MYLPQSSLSFYYLNNQNHNQKTLLIQFVLFLFQMHNLPYTKLKLNKIQRLKSRYKTQATQPNNHTFSEEQSVETFPESEHFSKVYNKLSNHFNANLLGGKRLYTQKDKKNKQQSMVRQSLKRSNNSFSHKARPSHVKSMSYEQSSHSHSPAKTVKKPISLPRPFLPAVKIVTDSHIHLKSNKTNKSQRISSHLHRLQPQQSLNKNFILLEGLMLHSLNVATVYNRIRRNLSVDAIMSSIQQYVLQSNNADISKLDLLFIVQQVKIQCRLFIFLERMIIVYIAETYLKKLKLQKTALKIMLHLICDQYVSLLLFLYNESYSIQKSNIKKVLSLIGVEDESQFKPKKLFVDNQDLIMKLNNMLKGNNLFRGYFHTQLPKIAMMSINQTFYSLLEHYSFELSMSFTICPEIAKFLSTCPSPYIHAPSTKDYTLVMDLDETLIHYNQAKSILLVRPHCKKFLTQLSEYYEIGIFTCAMPDYANWVLDELNCPISFRLYRYHTVQNQGCFLKDLNRLGRDLKKMIIVDNLCENFSLTPKNGIHIKGWTGQCQDKELLEIMDKLMTLAKLAPDDIRVCLGQILKPSALSNLNQSKELQ